MKIHLHNLFVPHHGNNHKPKLLHHLSLTKLVLLVLLSQLIISAVTQSKPGVLGFASNISVGEIVAQTNAERAAGGLAPLTYNETLSDSARRKAADMFADNYWAHNAPDGTSPWDFFQQVGYSYLYAGENLARDFNDSSAVTVAWMASTTHRENIMSGRYTEIGVAVVNGVLEGQETTLVVQHFGHPARSAPTITTEDSSPELAQAEVQGDQAEELEVFIQEEVAPEEVVDVTENVLPQTTEETTPEVTEEAQPTAYEENLEITEDINLKDQPLTNEYAAEPATSDSFAWLSAFDLTKSVNLALLAIIIIALAIDAILIWHRGITRRSGKSFVHLAFLILIALIVLLTRSGNIL